LRRIGFDRRFQWLDGSFVESKLPRDLDVFTFLSRPIGYRDTTLLKQLVMTNLTLFDRSQLKASFRLDFFAVDLDGSAETLVNMSRYFFGLFSHRRGDDLWKGMLQVRLENIADDAAAFAVVGPDPTAASAAGVNP
jgi:hypothetical protein